MAKQLSPDDREFYEERAAIREFDGRQSRAEAERDAWNELQQRVAEREAKGVRKS